MDMSKLAKIAKTADGYKCKPPMRPAPTSGGWPKTGDLGKVKAVSRNG